MIPYNATDPFFDSEGDEDKSNPGISLKGEYNRGGTPPSQYTSSPQQNDKRRDEGQSKPERDSPAYSRSSSENFTSESGIMSREKNSAKSYGTYSRSRSRSRSPRSSRSRSRSPTYSDSFNSEDSDQDSRGASPVRNKKSTRGRSNGTSNRFSSGTSKDSRSTFRSYGTTYTKATKIKKKGAPKQGGKGMGRSQSVSTLQQSPRTTEVTRRMLSAKGHTINRLRSDVDELQRKYDNVVRENKLMKQLQRRQEAALAKYDDKEEELPQLLQSHAAEVENLRERLRRTQDREKDKDRRLKEKNEALNKLNDELKKLRQLADDKRLLDRDRLQRKVDKLCDQLDEKERRVAELEKYVDNFKKNVKHDGDNWKHREREYRSRVSYLEEENQNLKYQLREKEKELDIRNIYSHRVLKPPVKLNTSLSPTPRPLAQTRATSNEDLKKNRPPPHPPVKRSSSAEEKKRKSSDAPSPREVEEMPKEEKKSPRKEKKEVELPPKRELSEEERILQDLDAGFKPHPQPKGDEDDILKDLDAGIQKRERGDEQQRRVEGRRKREKEEQEQRQRQKAEEEEKRRKEEKRKEEERKRKEEEERKTGRHSFFSDIKSSYSDAKSYQSKPQTPPYIPSFSQSNTKNSSNASNLSNSSNLRASKTKAEKEPSYKPTFSTNSPPSQRGVGATRKGVEKKEKRGNVFWGGGQREEKQPPWLQTTGHKAGSQQKSADFSGEKERKQKEEVALAKSSTFVTEGSPSAPKTPVFGGDSSSDEDNIPFFGSKPKAAGAGFKPSNPPPAAVNSVRDLHKYSSNARLNSGSSGNTSSREGVVHEKKREEEDLASQRRKQKEEADRLAEERKKKDLLLAKMRELDQKPDSRGSKKEYKFTQPIENLHNGKPSHPDLQGSPNSSATKKKPAPPADDAFGSYAPSFGRRAGAGASDKPPVKTGGLFDDDDDGDVDIFATPKPKQNNNLISNLFGDATATTPNKGRSSFEGTLFSNATKAKPVADSTALPWEKKQQGSLFSQPANKPNGITVNVPKSSFDDFDDDLEEVIL